MCGVQPLRRSTFDSFRKAFDLAIQRRNRKAKKHEHAGNGDAGISEREVEAVEEMSAPRTPVIYEVVRRQGIEEMERPATSLW
jgi:hypothetical protein